jgi:hypothetical protein
VCFFFSFFFLLLYVVFGQFVPPIFFRLFFFLTTFASFTHNTHQGETKKTSNYRGVHWHKSKLMWVSSIQVCGEKKCLGTFKTEEEAAKRYDADAMFFEDRQLNFREFK